MAAILFRHAVWQGSVSLCIRINDGDLDSRSNLIDTHYIQAPRISYLPLLLPDIHKYLLDLCLDEATLATLRDDQLWFEVSGEPLKWHWPIGLLYDYFLSNKPSTSTPSLSITLHLRNPPLDKLLTGPSVDSCRTSFMNLVKEADFVRWGNTRRVTALRKADQDALWEGVVNNDFDRFWSVAAKLIPSPGTTSMSPSSLPVSSPMSRDGSSTSSQPPSTLSEARLPEANAMRSVPLRIYLPLNLPVLQDVISPVRSDSTALTLYDCLSMQLIHLFPPRPTSMSNSFVSSKPLAKAIIHGIEVPLDSEIGFIASTLTSPSGFLEVVIKLART